MSNIVPNWPAGSNVPVRVRATPNITPFTYYDGVTYLELLEKLREWLNGILIPGIDEIIDIVNKAIDDALEGVATDLAELRAEIAAALESIGETDAELRAYVDDVLQQVINNSIELQDPVVAGLVGENDSLTRTALDTRYSIVAQVPAVTGDATDAIRAVVDASPGGTVRLAPGEVYNISGQIDIQAGTTIDGSGATLIVSPGQTAFNVEGGLTGPPASVSGIVRQGTTSITLAENLDVQEGDYIRLWGNEEVVIPPVQGETPYYGELLRVASVLANVVTVASPITATYGELSAARAQKVSLVEGVSFRNLNIVMAGARNDVGIWLDYTKDANISNCRIVGAGSAGLRIFNAVDSVVTGCTFGDQPDNVGAGLTGYGIAVGGVSDGGVIVGCTFNRMRHAITTVAGSNRVTSPITNPRRFTVVGCTAKNTSSTAFDTHAPGSAFNYMSNTVTDVVGSAFAIRGVDCSVKGNYVANARSHGVAIIEARAAGCDISGNTFIDVLGSGIRLSSQASRSKVTGNTFVRCNSAGVSFGGNTEYPIIRGNVFENCGGTSSSVVSGGADVTILNPVVDSNLFVRHSAFDDSASDRAVSFVNVGGVAIVSNNSLDGLTRVTGTIPASSRVSGNRSLRVGSPVSLGYSQRIFSDARTIAAQSSDSITVSLSSMELESVPEYLKLSIRAISAARDSRYAGHVIVRRQRNAGSAFAAVVSADSTEGNIGSGGDIVVSVASVSPSGASVTLTIQNATGAALDIAVAVDYD